MLYLAPAFRLRDHCNSAFEGGVGAIKIELNMCSKLSKILNYKSELNSADSFRGLGIQFNIRTDSLAACSRLVCCLGFFGCLITTGNRRKL